MALRIGRASPANDAMSSTIGVSSRLWTNANALPDCRIGPPERAAEADVAKTLEQTGDR